MLSFGKRTPLNFVRMFADIRYYCRNIFIAKRSAAKTKMRGELKTPFLDALRLFNFFNPFKGFGNIIYMFNPHPRSENPGSVSEKLRSNGHVCLDNQACFNSVGITPGFAIISSQYSYITTENGCFQKYPNDKKMDQHH